MDIVQVRFPNSSVAVTFAAGGHELTVGDYCVVETPEGERVVRVVRATWDSPAWDDQADRLRKVIRAAGREDEENHAHRFRQEENALADARRRIAARELPMRLTGVDRSRGGRRITYYFTAEGRVDFRALVRDLAVAHRARIEMRQIGVRDEAKLRGGYGHCGRPLCCSTWLPAFQPVSIRNAKSQGLALSPPKISGMCGRLMCCLRYELDRNGKPLPVPGCPAGHRNGPVKGEQQDAGAGPAPAAAPREDVPRTDAAEPPTSTPPVAPARRRGRKPRKQETGDGHPEARDAEGHGEDRAAGQDGKPATASPRGQRRKRSSGRRRRRRQRSKNGGPAKT